MCLLQSRLDVGDMSFCHKIHYKFWSYQYIEYHDNIDVLVPIESILHTYCILISVADAILNDYCVLQLSILQLNNFREQIKTMSICQTN